MDPFLGEIRLFAGNYAPNGWALCNGSLLPIRSYTALFSLLGTYYGGDGKVTFALPNLQARAAMHWGTGVNLTPRELGEEGGEAAHALLTTEMPAHTHVPGAVDGAPSNSTSPASAVWGTFSGRGSYNVYGAKTDTPMSPTAIGIAGASQPHNNMQPYLVMNYIIALNGIFPPRP